MTNHPPSRLSPTCANVQHEAAGDHRADEPDTRRKRRPRGFLSAALPLADVPASDL